jgi:hypothetical protein
MAEVAGVTERRPDIAGPKITYALESYADLKGAARRVPGLFSGELLCLAACLRHDTLISGEGSTGKLLNLLWNLKEVRFLVVCFSGYAPLDLNGVDVKNRAVRRAINIEYPRSNEGYAYDLRDTLRTLSGIQNYVGLCGGGDQNLFLLGLLSKKNELGKVTLVDYKVGQLLNFKEIAEAFNTRNSAEYASFIDTSSWGNRHKNCDWRHQKPEIGRDMRIDGVLYDIVDYIHDIREQGTYFFYLSNGLSDHLPSRHSERALKYLLGNRSISDGSTVMCVTELCPSKGVLLQKESEKAFSVVFSEEERIKQGRTVDAHGFSWLLRGW